MESNINLLPDKDKLLKRETKAPKDVVEMSTPQDRIFKERVLRMSGVVEFFKTVFKRKPAPLPKTKPAVVQPDASVQFPAPKPVIPAGPVTRLMTMPEKLAPKPAAKVRRPNFFRSLLQRWQRPKPAAGQPPVKPLPFVSGRPPVPPPPKPTVTPLPSPPPYGGRESLEKTSSMPGPFSKPLPPPPPAVVSPSVPVAPVNPPTRRPAWAPPAPGSGSAVPLPPLSAPPAPTAPHYMPPAPAPRRPGTLSEVTPILGAGLNVNLVPTEYQAEAPARDRLIALVAIGVALVLVAGTTFGLSLYRKSLDQKIADIDAKIETLGPQISALETGPLQQASVLRQRTADVTKALDQHVYWDTFFSKLEAVTLPTVSYSSMSADVSGSVTMAATATSFDEVGKQLLTYQNAKDFVTQATVLSATRTQGAAAATAPGTAPATVKDVVSFSVSLRVDSKAFYHTR
ncbi:MAG: hypothetical protein AAB445_02770 [Patescibacteria group bacterium]